jgi:hypothetical protein
MVNLGLVTCKRIIRLGAADKKRPSNSVFFYAHPHLSTDFNLLDKSNFENLQNYAAAAVV